MANYQGLFAHWIKYQTFVCPVANIKICLPSRKNTTICLPSGKNTKIVSSVAEYQNCDEQHHNSSFPCVGVSSRSFVSAKNCLVIKYTKLFSQWLNTKFVCPKAKIPKLICPPTKIPKIFALWIIYQIFVCSVAEMPKVRHDCRIPPARHDSF